MIDKNNQFFDSEKILSIAFETEFIKRSNYKIDPCLLLTSFIIVLAKGSYSLREWALKYSTFSETIISFQAIHKKLSIRCLSFLEGVVQYVLSNAIFHNTRYNHAIFDKFNRVIIEDSTCIKLCNALFESFSGNSNGTVKKTMSRIQFSFDLKGGQWLNGKLGTYKVTDNTFSTDIQDRVEKGDLVLRDLGYWNLSAFRYFVENEIYFLSKLKVGTAIFKVDGGNLDIQKLLKSYDKQGVNQVDMQVLIGVLKVPVRIVGYKLDSLQAQKKLSASKKSRHKNQPLSKLAMYLTSWNIFITNIEAEGFELTKIIDIYKLRWYIEMLFKNWKSNFNFEKVVSASKGPDPLKPEIMMYLSLIFMGAFFQPSYNIFNEILLAKSKMILSPFKFATRFKEKIVEYLKHIILNINMTFIQDEVLKLQKYCCYENRNDRKNMGQLIYNISP